MDFADSLGISAEDAGSNRDGEHERVIRYIVLKLIAMGLPHPETPEFAKQSIDAERLLGSYHQRLKRLDEVRSPADARIEAHHGDIGHDIGRTAAINARDIDGNRLALAVE